MTNSSPIPVAPVDPAAFGDPFAKEIDRIPLGAGAASAPTRIHSIADDGPGRLLLRGDARLQLVGYPLMAIGLVIIGFGVAALSTGFGAFLGRARGDRRGVRLTSLLGQWRCEPRSPVPVRPPTR